MPKHNIIFLLHLLSGVPLLAQHATAPTQATASTNMESRDLNLYRYNSKTPELEGWTFSASEALRVHKDYTLKDFR